MGHGDYPLGEFAKRLAEVESRFAKELHAIIECFVQSRLDLPAKRLEDLSKGHTRRARNLKKAVDEKKTDGVNLWKICNVYSAAAVDDDDAMREVRSTLKKHIRKETMKIRVNGDDVSTYRRVADDYRPLINSQAAAVIDKKENVKASLSTSSQQSDPRSSPVEPPEEIYDVDKPTLKEKQRWLEQWRQSVDQQKTEEKEREEVRRRIEKRQSMKIFGSANLSSLSNKLIGETKNAVNSFFGGGSERVKGEAKTRVEEPPPKPELSRVEPAPPRVPAPQVIVPGSGAHAEIVMKF